MEILFSYCYYGGHLQSEWQADTSLCPLCETDQIPGVRGRIPWGRGQCPGVRAALAEWVTDQTLSVPPSSSHLSNKVKWISPSHITPYAGESKFHLCHVILELVTLNSTCTCNCNSKLLRTSHFFSHN